MRVRFPMAHVLAATSSLAACSSAPVSDMSEPTDGTATALAALTSQAHLEGAHLAWSRRALDGERSHHLHLAGERFALPAGSSVEQRAFAFLDRHSDAIGLPAPSNALVRRSNLVDARGSSHLRFAQTIGGIEVVGGELTMHVSSNGELRSLDAHLVPSDGEAIEEATLSRGDAAERAFESVRAAFDDRAILRVASNDRVIVNAQGFLQPVYRILIDVAGSGPGAMQVDVHAATGKIIESLNILQTVVGSGVGSLGVKRELNVSPDGAGFKMVDNSRGSEIDTYSANQGTSVPGKLILSTSKDSWDTGVPAGAGAAVDAHFFAGVVYDYYKVHHARKGIDGNDGAMISSVHYGSLFDNAFWSPTAKQMGYGDGGTDLKVLPAALDVVAHEFTHGVTQATAKLTYQGAAGALNEAVSDIFAAFIEHADKADEQNNFLVGEVIGKNGPLRDMLHPSSTSLQYPQPAHMSEYVVTQQDNGGIHINSSIPNNAMALMTIGGTNDVSKVVVPRGIGWEQSEKLWYHALTNYFLSTDDFTAAANQTLEAASDLGFAESDRNVVECAWIAVGVLAGECKSTDPSGDPQTANPTTPRADADNADGGTGTSGPLNLRAGKGNSDCAVSSGPAREDPCAWILGSLLGMCALVRRKREETA